MNGDDTKTIELELKTEDLDFLDTLARDLNLNVQVFIKRVLDDYVYLKKNHKIDKDLRTWVEDLYEEAMTATVELKQYKNRSRLSLIFGRK